MITSLPRLVLCCRCRPTSLTLTLGQLRPRRCNHGFSINTHTHNIPGRHDHTALLSIFTQLAVGSSLIPRCLNPFHTHFPSHWALLRIVSQFPRAWIATGSCRTFRNRKFPCLNCDRLRHPSSSLVLRKERSRMGDPDVMAEPPHTCSQFARHHLIINSSRYVRAMYA